MKILVTGGLGFIGTNFIRFIFENYRDIRVVNLDNISYGANPANLKDYENDSRYRFVKGDIRNYKQVCKLINDADVVVNFAAETHVDRSIANPRIFLESNTIGLYNILEAVRQYNPKARVIHISTDEVYGDILEGSFTEDYPLKPSSPYSASKAAADIFCHAYHRTYNIDIIVTRCTNNFGPYQFPEKLIPKTIIRANMNLKVPIYGTGQNVRDWIYVLDHCEAIDMLIYKGRPGEVYNISSGNELENIKLVKMILSLMGKDESLIEFVEDRPGHDLRYSLDSSKIREEIGWKPKYSFRKAIEETINWYLSNRAWWELITDKRLLNPTPWKLKW
jgi:dTDP-glucose 4,6-dehydratase